MSAPAVAAPPTNVIEPSGGWRALDFRELWRFRELVFFLAQRDVKVRYKQTALGVAWVLLQPLLAMGIFSIVFGARGLSTDGVPYALFVVSGLVPWFYFANATSGASGSIVGNTQLISKVYFPRLAIPLAAVLANLVDFTVGLLLAIVLVVVFGLPVGLSLLALPLLMIFNVLTALGIGIWLAALDVQYRDVRYAVPFFIQVWLFATPVIYGAGDVPEQWRPILTLNPMTGIIEGFRWALLGRGDPPLQALAGSLVLIAVLLATGLLYFRRMERTFADVI
ncbi:MAG TPA: ABC transporter permease [Chloroflexota bacterium]|nr:ABC transporter permease [Chloroflexota bacterium]